MSTFILTVDGEGAKGYILRAMGRKKLSKTEKKVGIASKVAPPIKAAISKLAKREHRTESQTIEMLIEASPQLKEVADRAA